MSISIRYTWFVLGVLSLLLSACQTGEVQPTTSLTTAEPTETSSPTAKPTEIIIPTATNTLPPSKTPNASPTSSLPTPTPDWTAFDLDARISASPDGMWVARIVVAYPPEGTSGDTYHVLVRIDSASDRSIGWTVVDEWLPAGLGMTAPTVLRWTQDGGSLFIADTGVPDGCGPRFFLNARRVDLQTGEVVLLEPDSFGKLSVSPDGSSLVALSQNTGPMVHDLTGGEQREIDFEQPDVEWWPGEIVWSPDGREFLFDLSSDPCSFPEEVTSSIWLTSLEGGEASPLLQDDPRQLSVQSWPAACLALVNDREGGVWWLNPCTGEISQTPPVEVALAMDALLGFFEALRQGNYADAVTYYGGPYDALQDNNESIDPDDHAALLSNACQVNGYVCLPVLSYVLVSQADQEELRFSVTFDQNGETFVRGPCCGASAIDHPPDWQFTYTLVKDSAGAYRVQELPVYVP